MCFVTPCSLAGGYQRCAGPRCSGTGTWYSGTGTWYSLRDFFWDSWPLENGPIGCPETSVRNNHHTPRNIPEERISHGTVGLEGWYNLDQTVSCLPAYGFFNVVISSLKCGSTASNVRELSPLVTIYTASLTFSNSTFCPHSVFMCFVWIWEQTAIISLYNINWLVCITETECVYCAVRTGYSYRIHFNFRFEMFQWSTYLSLYLSICFNENKFTLLPLIILLLILLLLSSFH